MGGENTMNSLDAGGWLVGFVNSISISSPTLYPTASIPGLEAMACRTPGQHSDALALLPSPGSHGRHASDSLAPCFAAAGLNLPAGHAVQDVAPPLLSVYVPARATLTVTAQHAVVERPRVHKTVTATMTISGISAGTAAAVPLVSYLGDTQLVHRLCSCSPLRTVDQGQ